jgi:hypothetical protein
VAGTEPRLGYRFWGVNYKKGACTSPLFFYFQPPATNCPFGNPPSNIGCPNLASSFAQARSAQASSALSETDPQASTSGSACAWEWCYWPLKKMSGRWGDRPLGRGDGGYSNPKSVWFFRPFCCAREQQDDTQEQTGHYRCITPESQTTPDYLPSLFSTGFFVDSPLDSFSPVLPAPSDVPLFGTEVLPV